MISLLHTHGRAVARTASGALQRTAWRQRDEPEHAVALGVPGKTSARHSGQQQQVSPSKSASSHFPERGPRYPRSCPLTLSPHSSHYFLAARSLMPLSHASTASDCVRAVATAPRPSIARSARELSSRHTLLALSLAAVQLGARTSTSA